jgi:hypothetical protein
MVKAATAQRARAPQGAKRIAQAFFHELKTIADDRQAEVAKAAQAMVRETLMTRRESAKTAKSKLRAGKAAPAKRKTGVKSKRGTRGPMRGRKAPPRTGSGQGTSDVRETDGGEES